MLLTTLILNKTTTRKTVDSAFTHSMIYSMIGERGLWALPQRGCLIVQHSNPINWARNTYGVEHSHTTSVLQPKNGMNIEYALIGNATHRPHDPTKKRVNRKPLPLERSKEWLSRRLEKSLNLHTIDVTGLPPAKGRHNGRNTMHHRVLFTGTATVTDETLLREYQTTGVGAGKAYGCGLLVMKETN